MNINNKSLGLISSVFAITLGSANPAGACDWFCCGGDDEEKASLVHSTVPSEQERSNLTTSGPSIQSSIQEQQSALGVNHLTLKVEERQRLVQKRKDKLEEEKQKIKQDEEAIKQLEQIKSTTKSEEVKVTAEEFDLQQKQAELEKRKAALLIQTPIKGKQQPRIVTETEHKDDISILQVTPTPYPGEETEEEKKTSVVSETPIEEKIEETSIPTSMATYQEQLQDRRNLGQIGDIAWKQLESTNIQYATALFNAITENPDKKIEIIYAQNNNFRLRIAGKSDTQNRYF